MQTGKTLTRAWLKQIFELSARDESEPVGVAVTIFYLWRNMIDYMILSRKLNRLREADSHRMINA